jgi:hypothetical protein
MRKVIVNEFMSLDGVAQAPGGADEDTGRCELLGAARRAGGTLAQPRALEFGTFGEYVYPWLGPSARLMRS